MVLWIIAILLFVVLGIIGYYQGAIRVGVSLIGIIVAAALALPLSGIVTSMLPAFGIAHPVLLAFMGPAIIYLLVLIVFKTAAIGLHKTVDTHYKYKTSDTQRRLWERMNERLGICLAMANAAVYLVLIGVVAYTLGYATVQISSADKDYWLVRLLNTLNEDMKATAFDKVVSALSPATSTYYDGADILGNIYHNPLLQSRLSSYPVFLTLTERPEFQEISKSVPFQEFWQKNPTISEFVNHEKIKPIVVSTDFYKEVMGMLGGDLKDIKGYLETGKSAKYDEETILGRWEFEPGESMKLARKNKPNLNSVEITRLRKVYRLAMAKSTVLATVDGKVVLKIPAANNVTQGTWKSGNGGRYILTMVEGNKNVDVQASTEANKLTVIKDGLSFVFEK